MDQRNEFSKWMQAVEEALSDEKKEIAESMPVAGNPCGCGSWDCPACFPEQDESPGGVTPVVVAGTGGQMCPACAGAQAQVCPACGQPHGNQDGQMSPMSMPPQGEVETEVSMQGDEFDGELEELSPPTLAAYRDSAINQHRGMNGGKNDPHNKFLNRDSGITGANDRLGNKFDDFRTSDEMEVDDGLDDFNEPDAYDYNTGGAYGGRHDDYHSMGTARGFEEDGAPEEPEVDRTPSNGKPGVKLGHITQKFEPIGGDPAGEESPLTYGEDNLDENDYDDREPSYDELAGIENSTDPMVNPAHANQDVESIMYMQSMGLSMSENHYDEKELYTLTPEQLQSVKAEVLGGQQAPMGEDDMMQDMSGQPQQATGGTLGGAGAQMGGGSGGYAPGTAPTMPESIQRNTMENIDSDIARVMKGFSQYDALKASKAIVSEKKKDEKEEKIDEEGNPWAKGGSKSEEADDKKETKTHKGGTVTKTETGIKHKGTYGGEKKDVKESAPEADAEVLEWMQRFSKLGKMSGFGR